MCKKRHTCSKCRPLIRNRHSFIIRFLEGRTWNKWVDCALLIVLYWQLWKALCDPIVLRFFFYCVTISSVFSRQDVLLPHCWYAGGSIPARLNRILSILKTNTCTGQPGTRHIGMLQGNILHRLNQSSSDAQGDGCSPSSSPVVQTFAPCHWKTRYTWTTKQASLTWGSVITTETIYPPANIAWTASGVARVALLVLNAFDA